MSTQTLLQMTQEILQSMQSDEVESILDTGESTAVAYTIRRTYWDMFGILDLPEHYTLFKLTETSSSTPTLMTLPANVMKVEWLKYNCEQVDDTNDHWEDIEFRHDFKSFLELGFGQAEDSDIVDTISYTFNPTGVDTVKIFYNNNRNPRLYATPDDSNVLFDSYNSEIETFLRSAKTLAYGLVDPTFTLTDGFTPDLSQRQMSLLFNEAKAQCFAELKQVQNAKAEQRARQLKISSQRTKQRVEKKKPLDDLPNYGKKR